LTWIAARVSALPRTRSTARPFGAANVAAQDSATGEPSLWAFGGALALGIILIVLGLLFGSSILWTLGIIALVIGAVFWILGALDRPVYGRRHYW
jgi:hypothetical protein